MARIIAKLNNQTIIVEQSGDEDAADIKVIDNNGKTAVNEREIEKQLCMNAEIAIGLMKCRGYVPYVPNPRQINGIYEGLRMTLGEDNIKIDGDPYYKEHEWQEQLEREHPGIVF